MDIDTTPPASHHEPRPPMQLDLAPADDVMMEVDPDFSAMPPALTAAAAAAAAATAAGDPAAPGVLAGASPAAAAAAAAAAASPPASAAHATAPPARSPCALEAGSHAARLLPAPPVVLIAASDAAAWPKFKLDQLFVEWLAKPDTRKWLDALMDDARAGKTPEMLVADQSARAPRMERSSSPGPSRSPNASQVGLCTSPQQSPGSPVSRLFSNHLLFGDADSSSPRSPPAMMPGGACKGGGASAVAGALDLGQSGSASPNAIGQQQEKGGTNETGRTRQMDGAFVEGPLPDSKALDKVADGIAGMTAAVDPSAAEADETAEPAAEMRVDSPSRAAKAPEDLQPRGSDQSLTFEQQSAVKLGPDVAEGQAKPVPETTDAVREVVAAVTEGHVSAADPASLVAQSGATVVEAAAAKLHASIATAASMEQKLDEGAFERSQSVGEDAADGKSANVGDFTSMDDERGFVSSAMPPTGGKAAKSADETMGDARGPKTKKSLPRFYFPCGKDADVREQKEREAIKEFFKAQQTQKNVAGLSRTDLAELVVDVIGLPSYLGNIIFSAIQELFPRRRAESLAPSAGGQGDAPSSSAAPSGGEVAMKDVSEKTDGDQAGNLEAGQSSNREERDGTNSDTTMGDVNELHSEERRANGFGSSSTAQGDSSAPSTQQGAATADSSPIQPPSSSEFVTEEQVTAYYDSFCAGSSKERRLFSALSEPRSSRDYLVPSDFKALLRALLLSHRGLAFLHATPEFQQRYSETVIERIYFGCTRKHNGRLTLNDIKRSKLLDTLMVVDEEEDINRERKYFSYEHFYVLYCRFWELDANHDLQIDREDLMRYGSHSLTYRIVDRIFGGYARPLDAPENPGFMSYTDFIWFCLSEEDKTSETAIDYWFRCVDMDGDGLITMYDMEFFYKEQLHRMECFGHEPVQIKDILCQLLDMINPNVQPPVIRRRDLKRCRLAGNFFNVLFNLNKFFAIEARDPLQIRQEHATPELTDWDRFAALEYLRLSAEEEGEEDESWEDAGESANPLIAGEAPF